jgi:transposase
MRSASSHPLVPYGWDADWAAEFAPYAAAGLLPGRVVRVDIPSPRKITSWIMCRREDLSTKDDERLLQVRLACPDITRACDLARTFHDLVTHRRGHLLMDWIRQAEQDSPAPMHGFGGFLRQDLAAVTAGLALEWSSGVVEGNVNRVKTIKRSMYNRASFRLLRIRILTRP